MLWCIFLVKYTCYSFNNSIYCPTFFKSYYWCAARLSLYRYNTEILLGGKYKGPSLPHVSVNNVIILISKKLYIIRFYLFKVCKQRPITNNYKFLFW
ncbi:Uncharacterised protein [Klebsiella pneumoniae]|nr:Uncharacterised protein [Klebsiella pneumoniae]